MPKAEGYNFFSMSVRPSVTSARSHYLGNHVIFYTYIWTERVGVFVVISSVLDGFSYGKAQILHCAHHQEMFLWTLYFSAQPRKSSLEV